MLFTKKSNAWKSKENFAWILFRWKIISIHWFTQTSVFILFVIDNDLLDPLAFIMFAIVSNLLRISQKVIMMNTYKSAYNKENDSRVFTNYQQYINTIFWLSHPQKFWIDLKIIYHISWHVTNKADIHKSYKNSS